MYHGSVLSLQLLKHIPVGGVQARRGEIGSVRGSNDCGGTEAIASKQAQRVYGRMAVGQERGRVGRWRCPVH